MEVPLCAWNGLCEHVRGCRGDTSGAPQYSAHGLSGDMLGAQELWGCPRQAVGGGGYLVCPTLCAVQGRVQLGLAGRISFHQTPESGAHQMLLTREER